MKVKFIDHDNGYHYFFEGKNVWVDPNSYMFKEIMESNTSRTEKTIEIIKIIQERLKKTSCPF